MLSNKINSTNGAFGSTQVSNHQSSLEPDKFKPEKKDLKQFPGDPGEEVATAGVHPVEVLQWI